MADGVKNFYTWARGRYVQYHDVREDPKWNLIECKICGEIQVIRFGARVWVWTYNHLSENHDHIITLYSLAYGKIEFDEAYYRNYMFID